MNKTFRVSDYITGPHACTEDTLNASFYVYSFKQIPRQNLERNYLLDELFNNETHHYGRILVMKLDSDGCVQNMRPSDYALVKIIISSSVIVMLSSR